MKKYLVYVVGKYTDTSREKIKANIEVADKAAKELLKLGFIPIVPHKNSAFWDDDPEIAKRFHHQEWLTEYCFPLQERCDMTFLSENWVGSLGSEAEHVHAHEIGQPHSDSITSLCFIREWLKRGEYEAARGVHNEILSE